MSIKWYQLKCRNVHAMDSGWSLLVSIGTLNSFFFCSITDILLWQLLNSNSKKNVIHKVNINNIDAMKETFQNVLKLCVLMWTNARSQPIEWWRRNERNNSNQVYLNHFIEFGFSLSLLHTEWQIKKMRHSNANQNRLPPFKQSMLIGINSISIT